MEYYENNNDSKQYTEPKETNTMAVISMVLGIIGVLACCAFPVAILFGVAAVVLAILSKKGKPFSGFAIAGLVLGIIAVLLGLLMFAYIMIVTYMYQSNPDFFNSIMEEYENMTLP